MVSTKARRLALLIALAAASIPALALAGPETSSVDSYTGCLTDTGDIVKVAVGAAPLAPCAGTETQIALSSGDITSVATPSDGGLTGGTESGDASLSLGGSFKLPQGCAGAQVPKFVPPTRISAAGWKCGNDNVIDRSTPSATTHALPDATGDVGGASAITIGADGFGLVAYYDSTNANLKVAHCLNVACFASDTTPIDTTGDVGKSPAIALGKDGFGLISYYDATGHNLKVAHCADIACSSATKTTLDSAGDVGASNSIAIGTDGLGLISYYDTTNRRLKTAHCTNTACSSATTVTLDSGPNVGVPNSIAIGADGLGLIAYGEFAEGSEIHVAHCSNVACTSAGKTTVATGGFAISIAIGADGLGLIAWYEFAPQSVWVTHCSNVTCSSSTYSMVSPSWLTGGTSLTIGADGLGVLSYVDAGNVNLRMAHCANVACSTTTTSIAGNVGGSGGGWGGVTIGTDGLPLFSYYDATNHDLRVGHCSNTFCVGYLRRR
jgi:hypothetical protein